MSLIHFFEGDTKSIITETEKSDVQPNAIDVRVDKFISVLTSESSPHAYKDAHGYVMVLSEDKKITKHRKTFDVRVVKYGDDFDQSYFDNFNLDKTKEYFVLSKGVYEFVTKHNVEIAEGEAGWLIPRSTLNRNGNFITSGLYDSGYKGVLGGVMHISALTIIERNARIGQFVLVNSESTGLYEGSYGDHSDYDKQKYTRDKDLTAMNVLLGEYPKNTKQIQRPKALLVKESFNVTGDVAIEKE